MYFSTLLSKVRYFKDKGYAFVRYDNKESACNAIVALHLTEVEIEQSYCDLCVELCVIRLGGRLSSAAGARREEEANLPMTLTMEVAAVVVATTAIRSVR